MYELDIAEDYEHLLGSLHCLLCCNCNGKMVTMWQWDAAAHIILRKTYTVAFGKQSSE